MKSIKRNFVYTVLLNVTSVIFPLITAPYVARVLEPEGVGLFNFANTYAGYFALFALLGIPTYGIRETAKRRDNKESLSMLVSQMMTIAGISTIMVSSIFVLSLLTIRQLSANFLIFLIAGFSIYLAPFKINWIFQGIEEFGYITFRSLVIRIISILCLFIFVRDKEDLIIYIILNVLGSVIADIWNYIMMLKVGIHPKFTIKGLDKHLKPLLILFASTIAISFYTMIDTLMLGFFSNYVEVGYYNNASHLVRMILVTLGSLSTVALPRISYYMKDSDISNINRIVNKSFSFLSLLLFPIVIGILCVSSTFIPLFLGSKFVGAVTPLIILSFMMIPLGFNNLTGTQILIGMGYDKYFLNSMLTGALINFCLNLLVIPYWGAIGASFSSAIAELSVLIATLYYIFKYTKIEFSCIDDFCKSLVGAVALLPLFYVLNNYFSGWLLIIIFVILSCFTYFLVEKLMCNSSMETIIVIVSNTKNRILNNNIF